MNSLNLASEILERFTYLLTVDMTSFLLLFVVSASLEPYLIFLFSRLVIFRSSIGNRLTLGEADKIASACADSCGNEKCFL
jgi:hypothetical protein